MKKENRANPATNSRLTQLEDIYRANRQKKEQSAQLFSRTQKPRQSNHKKETLGYWADQLQVPADKVINLFSRAGINGVSIDSYISLAHKAALLDYLRLENTNTKILYIEKNSIEKQIIVVQSITEELLLQLAEKPDLMHKLDPRRFEELVARLLEDQGCEVTLTKRTRDGGYDIFGRLKGAIASPVFLAECKRYAPGNKVGVDVVRGLYAVTEIQRANIGLVITSSSFTKDAIKEKLQIGSRIELKEFNDLCSWLSPYANTSHQ